MSSTEITKRGCTSCSNGSAEGSACSSKGYNKLDVYDWLSDLPQSPDQTDIVEIRFKNTRKGFYRNANNLPLVQGDIVAVEASPGHDIGVVSLTGELVIRQLKKYHSPADGELKKIYRKAKPVDIEKWMNAIELEHTTMIETRRIADSLRLNMKIGDVEFQGDGTKAIFYYIADERVDFRELIKILADKFKIRIEMRQIGARQEAGRIGGIGSCGRELCCSTWITSFVSVTTNAARYQELSLNPQKLAGQCGKLKCCLNYELDCYIDAQNGFPSVTQPLEVEEGKIYHQKTDIFKGLLWYSFEHENAMNMFPLTVDQVKEIQELNRRGKRTYTLKADQEERDKKKKKEPEFANVVGQDNIERFDSKPNHGNNIKKRKVRNKPNNQRPQGPRN